MTEIENPTNKEMKQKELETLSVSIGVPGNLFFEEFLAMLLNTDCTNQGGNRGR